MSALPAQPPSPIRIGLGRALSSAQVTAPQGLYVIGDGEIHWVTEPGQVVTLNLAGGQIQVAGLAQLFDGPVRLVSVGEGSAESNPITYNRQTYRGEIEVLITPKAKRLSVVNVVNLEDYLQGVVPREMISSWPMEALKAQAVAARTYALRNVGQYGDEGFDLVDTVASQAYGGLSAERPSTNEAVVATAGILLTYGGQLATTMYHSSSGGHTENNEIIYAGPPVPYLRGVPDFDDLPGNERFSWRYTYTVEEFTKRIAATNPAIGTVTRVEPGGNMGSSGRPSRWELVGLNGATSMTAQQLRTALDMPSSAKGVTVTSAGLSNATRTYQPAETLYVVGADGATTARKGQGVAVVGAAQAMTEAQGAVTALGPVTNQHGGVVVIGGGYGHAVGMSQWGANGLALQGKSYAEILTYFYTGTQVEVR